MGLFLLFILFIIFLIIFKNNKHVKPIARFVNAVLSLILCFFGGSVFGFFLGYLSFGKVLGTNISLNAILSGGDDYYGHIPEIVLSPIRQKIFIATVLGALAGVAIYLIVTGIKTKQSKRHTTSFVSLSDELIKLSELKEKGIITQREFDEQKEKLLNQ